MKEILLETNYIIIKNNYLKNNSSENDECINFI